MLKFKHTIQLFKILALCALTAGTTFADKTAGSEMAENADPQSQTIGILGGMGPHSSSVFYLDVIDDYLKYENTRPSILLWNVPLNLAKEAQFIESGAYKDYYLEKLISGSQHLKDGKADFVVIPCNTVHLFFDELEAAVDIKFLSIVNETKQHLIDNNVKEVLFLATSTTIESELYLGALDEAGIEVHLPSKADQKALDNTIINIVGLKETAKDQETLDSIIAKFEKKGVSTMLLACTDLQELIKQEDNQMKVYDSMDILSYAAAKEAAQK